MPEGEEYKPFPYSFVMTDSFDRPFVVEDRARHKIVASCPPFHILLDHTIAVLWILFSPNEICPLRSDQISWALKFLEGITNDNDSSGNFYGQDIPKTIHYLQCALVNCIASEATNDYDRNATKLPIEHSISQESEEDKVEGSSSRPVLDLDRSNILKSILLRDMLWRIV